MWQGSFFDVHPTHEVGSAQGQGRDHAGRFDAGQRAKAGEKSIEESDDLFAVRISVPRQANPRGKKTFVAQASWDVAEMGETLDQQTGADQQDKRDRHFRHNERVAENALLVAAAADARLKCGVEINARSLPGRDRRLGAETDQRGRQRRPGVFLAGHRGAGGARPTTGHPLRPRRH